MTFTQRGGEICKPVHKEQNTLVLMQLHSRLTSTLLMLLPLEIYATKRFYTSTHRLDEDLRTALLP